LQSFSFPISKCQGILASLSMTAIKHLEAASWTCYLSSQYVYIYKYQHLSTSLNTNTYLYEHLIYWYSQPSL
jgi:hypothetical protein